ncbi:bestrophin-4 isoform X2 [Condylostylus longicornis]|uniref:bestrophin-4 isoform X2 n=1 Tax=Condylostylus longicornis TaxID=2530218 RepID=UPI00244E5367|nr:bestrophin-4 isoform X2 [Condylostylus longicornis]
MTVTYTAEVATCRGFGTFLKLLLRWRGSIYKLVWLDLTAFLFLYYVLNIVYRVALNADQKKIFESIVQYCAVYSNLIPLSFVLGFYVSIVMTRWWNQYTSIPWPDPIAVFVSANIHGQDERGRVMRRSVMRYVCLCLTMVLINISPRVKKRFPTLDNLIEAGLLVENEKNIVEKLNVKFPRHSKHWLPIVWAASIITRARKEGRIRDDFAVKTIIDELNKFRGLCGKLIAYDTISVPLVYTQVVTLAVYSYFLTAVMGQQWVENKEIASGYLNRIDMYFPIFSTLQFFFYMGWLKVAESLINPFGDDDDDFEVNWIVDRNLQVSYMIVDEMHHEHPELIKDQYWDQIFPNELPYTVASERFREEHPEPSTAKIEVPKQAAMATNMSSVRVDEMADDASGIHFTAGNGKVRLPSRGSSPSLASVSGTMSRVNTVASALRRLLSREGATTPTCETPQMGTRLPGSVSSASLTGQKNLSTSAGTAAATSGSMRIADQVIEEVDEQLTITSQRHDPNKPHVQDIFGGLPPPSKPVDVPISKTPQYIRTQSHGGDIAMHSFYFPPGGVDALLSTSAPPRDDLILGKASPLAESEGSLFQSGEIGSKETVEDMDNKSITNDPAESMEIDDDFERLRLAREKERIERQKQKIARSISTQPVQAGTTNIEVGTATVGDQTVDFIVGSVPSTQAETPDTPVTLTEQTL